MKEPRLTLAVLPDTFAICRLPSHSPLPAWAANGVFSSVTRTADELSVVCLQNHVPEGLVCEKDWRCLKVHGPLDFALTGILASLASTLANAGISLFAVSTFETDHILVRQNDLPRAIQSLSEAGHLVQGVP